MRRPFAQYAAPIFTALALLGNVSLALAQQTMDFHPLPPESAAAIEPRGSHRIEIQGSDRNGRKGVHVVIDSTGGIISLPGGKISSAAETPETPDTPPPPDTPEPPSDSAHETTGEIVRFGTDIHVPENQVVEGDVVGMGGSVRVDGTVRGSVTSMGGDVTLSPTARVDGDVVCLGGTLHEEDGSSVGGQRVTAPRVPGSRFLLPVLSVVGTGVKVVTHLFVMLILMGIAFLFTKLAPGRTQTSVEAVRREPGMNFLVGLLLWGMLIPSLVVIAIAAAILCITIIGIPLAIAALVGYAFLLVILLVWGSVVGYAVLGGHLQQRLRGESISILRAALWGIAGVYGLRIVGDLLHIVPVFGFLGGMLNVIAIVAGVVLATLGAGALLREEYSRRTVQDWWHRSRPRRGVVTPAGAPASAYPPPPAPEPVSSSDVMGASAPPPPPPPPASPASGGEPPATPIA